MSRNVDKANSVLAVYQEAQAEQTGGYRDFSRLKRPTRVNSVSSLEEAREWRRQLVLEIKAKITRLFDRSLNLLQIRELSDDIDELLREKGKWDWNIRHRLGGGRADASEDNGRLFGGRVVMGTRYFGRALELPEVVALTARQRLQDEQQAALKNVVDPGLLPRDTDSPYYKGASSDAEQWHRSCQALTDSLQAKAPDQADSQLAATLQSLEVPTLKDVEHWLVMRRKEKLLRQLDL
ncbi:hypothetical protein TPHA_0O00480 [Tetrapisispora phaffii CBS 4417]|uniref:Pre-mRNA-splicing factor ISY1 n=1 Tax=Tetrapisispora phaffii (strain ATCC 24235 / CBS 4417 / NBRC 1672 / NRRL Y-8282 / UCD 70-5) TaxID=1071381 RepID=G8C1J0_TETPH|nr:hypothetical protein TPHA_0O00480 [Tetrapisispora phaffii CBS 4417]CCE66018.1 hypothetical protein TPHA_0O00480 [Tetrapisispora phaffii CBS 4417]